MDPMTAMPEQGYQPKEVNYRKAEVPTQQCGMCGNFSPPSACLKVVGKIEPAFTCDLWTPLESAPPGGQAQPDLMQTLFGG